MNIHFTDKNLKEQLDLSTIFKIEVGSGMYGLKTPESDTDILCIYLEGSLNLTSITQTHHQLQYNDEENNIDYIYTSLGQFVKNIISGGIVLLIMRFYSTRNLESNSVIYISL